MSDKALREVIGRFIKHHRLQKNLSQATIAHSAGISRSTLSLLERGETVTVSTFLQVLRTLELLHVMDVFEVRTQISPMQLAKMEREHRKHASGKPHKGQQESDW
ncbi:MAG: helix-turn-helix domain-containing protein [Flavobacteriaceae bacterium]|nr:helix-turn-helix domain-containing protein [Flavobacteriaceae bacterium]